MVPSQAAALAKRAAGAGLLKVEEAREILAQCRRVDDAKSIRDQAEAIRAYLRQQNASRDAQNDAAEIKLRAERRLGELLAEQKETGERDAGRGGDRKSRLQDATVKRPPTLEELGIEKTAAKRWQDVAKVPEERFEEYIQAMRVSPVGEITTAGLSRLAVDQHRSAAMADDNEDERFTPRVLIEALHKAYRFDVDAAGHEAAPASQVIGRAWLPSVDGLKQSWKDERVFVNPPFSQCAAWVEKADRSVRKEGCPLVVMVLPAVRTEQDWWQKHIEQWRDDPQHNVQVTTRFLPGRTRYGQPLDPEGAEAGSPRFGSVLVMWARGQEANLRQLDLTGGELELVAAEAAPAAAPEIREDGLPKLPKGFGWALGGATVSKAHIFRLKDQGIGLCGVHPLGVGRYASGGDRLCSTCRLRLDTITEEKKLKVAPAKKDAPLIRWTKIKNSGFNGRGEKGRYYKVRREPSGYCWERPGSAVGCGGAGPFKTVEEAKAAAERAERERLRFDAAEKAKKKGRAA